MANKVITMQQIRTIIQLLEKAYSLRAIAAEISLSRQSVTFYATRLKASACSFEALRQLPDAALAAIVYAPEVTLPLAESARRLELDGRMPYFLSELKRTGVTRLLLWEEYRKESSDPFRYTQFCILLKQAGKITNATMHLVHTPAAMVMVDFAGDKMSYVDRSTGEVISCPVFIAVLPFSKYTFAIVLRDASIPQVIKALNACMAYFGGSAQLKNR
jgi:transposase